MRGRFAAFAGEKVSIQNTGGTIEDPAVHLLRNLHYPMNGDGLSLDPEYLATGSNSGSQALNLAVLAGGNPILLCGFDAHEPGQGEPTHHHGGHPVQTPIGAYQAYRRGFAAMARPIKALGVRVINCSPVSAIGCFEKMTLAEALEC